MQHNNVLIINCLSLDLQVFWYTRWLDNFNLLGVECWTVALYYWIQSDNVKKSNFNVLNADWSLWMWKCQTISGNGKDIQQLYTFLWWDYRINSLILWRSFHQLPRLIFLKILIAEFRYVQYSFQILPQPKEDVSNHRFSRSATSSALPDFLHIHYIFLQFPIHQSYELDVLIAQDYLR